MKTNTNTTPAYDRVYGIDILDPKGQLVVNLKSYTIAKAYCDRVAAEREAVIRANNNADLAYSRAYNAYWNAPTEIQRKMRLPERQAHKRPPQLYSMRYYAPGQAPTADTASK